MLARVTSTGRSKQFLIDLRRRIMAVERFEANRTLPVWYRECTAARIYDTREKILYSTGVPRAVDAYGRSVNTLGKHDCEVFARTSRGDFESSNWHGKGSSRTRVDH